MLENFRANVLKRPRKVWDWYKDEKYVNEIQISIGIWEFPLGTTFSGIPFIPVKLPLRTNQKVVFHLHPKWNFRNFFGKGKTFLVSILLTEMEYKRSHTA